MPVILIFGNGLLSIYKSTLKRIIWVASLLTSVFAEDICPKEAFFLDNQSNVVSEAATCTFNKVKSDTSTKLFLFDIAGTSRQNSFSLHEKIYAISSDATFYLFKIQPYQISLLLPLCGNQNRLNIQLDNKRYINELSISDVHTVLRSYLSGYIDLFVFTDQKMTFEKYLGIEIEHKPEVESLGSILLVQSRPDSEFLSKYDELIGIVDLDSLKKEFLILWQTRGRGEKIPYRYKCTRS